MIAVLFICLKVISTIQSKITVKGNSNCRESCLQNIDLPPVCFPIVVPLRRDKSVFDVLFIKYYRDAQAAERHQVRSLVVLMLPQ